MCHYAADVAYNSENFVSRNNDSVHHDLAQLPPASTDPLMLEMFDMYKLHDSSEESASASSTPRAGDADKSGMSRALAVCVLSSCVEHSSASDSHAQRIFQAFHSFLMRALEMLLLFVF